MDRSGVERRLLPDWILGTYLPVAVLDGKRSIEMVSIRELRERLVSTSMKVVDRNIRADGSIATGSVRNISTLFDRHYLESPTSLVSLESSQAGMPVVSLANFREWVNFRFSLSTETFLLGADILHYCEAMRGDSSISYTSKSFELDGFRIEAGSGDIAYFSGWVMQNVWNVPTYLISGKFPDEKVFCVAGVAGMWNPIYLRKINGHVVDMNFEAPSAFVKDLQRSGAQSVAISEIGDKLEWLPCEESKYESILS